MNIATHARFRPSLQEESCMLVVMRVHKQLLGVPVDYVRDVLMEYEVAPIPLSPPEIYGSINLRGRIVTVLDIRQRLKLDPGLGDTEHMFVVIEHNGEYYSLMVDSVGEVLTIPNFEIEKCPSNLGAHWRDVTTGVHRLQNELLVIVDIPTLLTF